jgi:hypothetical protein
MLDSWTSDTIQHHEKATVEPNKQQLLCHPSLRTRPPHTGKQTLFFSLTAQELKKQQCSKGVIV